MLGVPNVCGEMRAPPRIGFKFGEFSERLCSLRSSNEIRALITEVVEPLGFHNFAYHIIQTPDIDNLRTRQSYVITSYPDAWARHYTANGYQNEDPVVGLVFQARAPFVWRDKIKVEELSRSQRKLLDDARSAGIADGVTIPLQSRAGEVAAFSLIPHDLSSEALHAPELLNTIHLIGEYLHNHAARIVIEETLTNSSKRRRGLLSPRETEALTWVARGKSTWEISRILAISEKSVEFYLESCKHKLQASNRTQAVVKAIVIGIISFKE